MVEVEYQPWKKIVIHEAIKYNLDSLVRIQSLGVEPGGLAQPLLWAKGTVLSKSVMPETEDIVKEKLEGGVHWPSVIWAPMPEFKEVIIIKETNVKVPIIDVSTHPIYKAVAKWLREHT